MRCPICNNTFANGITMCPNCNVFLGPSGDSPTYNQTSQVQSNQIRYNVQPMYQNHQQASYRNPYGQVRPAYQQYVYDQARQPISTASIISMVLGIISLISIRKFLVGLFLSIWAIIFSLVGYYSNKGGKGMAIAGLVCGLIALVLLFFIALTGAALYDMLLNNFYG